MRDNSYTCLKSHCNREVWRITIAFVDEEMHYSCIPLSIHLRHVCFENQSAVTGEWPTLRSEWRALGWMIERMSESTANSALIGRIVRCGVFAYDPVPAHRSRVRLGRRRCAHECKELHLRIDTAMTFEFNTNPEMSDCRVLLVSHMHGVHQRFNVTTISPCGDRRETSSPWGGERSGVGFYTLTLNVIRNIDEYTHSISIDNSYSHGHYLCTHVFVYFSLILCIDNDLSIRNRINFGSSHCGVY